MPSASSIQGSQPSLGRMAMIDALRGLAAFAVLLFHSLNTYATPAALSSPLRVVHAATEYGYLGVSVFFALSGWCIAQRFQAAVRRKETVAVFAVERVLRIYPTYWAAFLITLILRLASTAVRHQAGLLDLPAGGFAWLGDLFLIQPYLHTAAYVLVSWTLVYELGFYLVAAAALAVQRRRRLPAGWWLLAGGVLSLWPFSPWQPTALLVLGRWPEFFAGVVAWRAASLGTPRAFAAGILGLLLLALVLPASTEPRTRFVAVGTALVLLLSARNVLPIFKTPGFWTTLGGFSYSLYLIHLAVLSPFLNLAGRFVAGTALLFVPVWLTGLALAVGAGWSLHRWVEAPVERWRRSLFRSRSATSPASS